MLSDTMMLGGGRKAAYPIENSLLFRGGQYLSRTFSAGDRTKWTYSAWVRRASSDTVELLNATNGGEAIFRIQSGVDGDRLSFFFAGSLTFQTTAMFRDFSGWYHVVLSVDTSHGSATDRVKLFINGAQVTAFASSSWPAQYALGTINDACVHYIGRNAVTTFIYTKGYQGETCFVDGAALTPATFGEVDSVTGSWRPKPLTGITWGTNGFHLKFNGLTPGGSRSAAQKFGGTMNGIAKGTYTNGTGIYNINTLNSGGYKTSGRWYMGHATSQRWLVWAKQGDSIHGNYGTTAASVLVGHSPLRYHYIKIAGDDFEQVNDSAGNWPVDSGTYYWTVLDLDAGRVEFYNPSGIYLFERTVAGWTPGAAYSTATCSFDSISVYFNLQDEPPRALQGPGTGWDSIVDASGRGNTVTAIGFAATDVVKDTPTNVYATLNAISQGHPTYVATGTLSDGNLVLAATNNHSRDTTLAAKSGKYYAEVTVVLGGTMPFIGVRNFDAVQGWVFSNTGDAAYLGNATKQVDGQVAVPFPGASSYGTGDVIGVALDIDGLLVSFYKNGLFQGSIPLSVAGARYGFGVGGANNANTFATNFGQRPFTYAPPAGFKPLCSANLPPTSGMTSGTFSGNANAEGPCIFTGAVPATLTINGNAVTWGTHADKLATGFKIRTASASYNMSGSNSWTATYDRKPTVGAKGRAPANAQSNP